MTNKQKKKYAKKNKGDAHLKARAKQHTVYKNADGKRVPGVTTILGVIAKPHLIPWANRLGLEGVDSTKYTSEAATIGTLAHDMVHEYLDPSDEHKVDFTHYSISQVQLAEQCLESFYEWLALNPIEVIFLEKAIVSEAFQYGGCIDCYCRINGKFVLLDFKTGSGIYPDMAYQLAGYANNLKEIGHIVDYAMILNIPRGKNESFITARYDDLTIQFNSFLAAQTIYNNAKLIKGGV